MILLYAMYSKSDFCLIAGDEVYTISNVLGFWVFSMSLMCYIIFTFNYFFFNYEEMMMTLITLQYEFQTRKKNPSMYITE